ncbi:MAG: acyltransferase family protein, partial [Elusimicrobiota bacterium]|nr:acyltransferase family protein [Elusimicrobiota bacterium]
MKNAMRVSYLDGLRGWAALIVCVYHTASLFGYKNATAPLSNFLIFIQNKYFNLIFDGNLSVRIFFILSGIVLSISFIKNPDLKKLAALLIKRIPRLSIPIFAMSLISHFLVKSGLMFNVAANEILGYYGLLPFHYKLDSTLFNVFESSFLLPFFSYANSSGEYANAAWANTMLYSNVLWTMPHEMIGSIFVAVALFLASFINKSKRIIAITIAFVGLIILAYQNALFAGTLICFLFGILLAYYLINRHKTWRPPPRGVGGNINCGGFDFLCFFYFFFF